MEMMFIVYDSKGRYYEKPFFAKSFGDVERMFHALKEKKESTIGKYPHDFTVFHTGSFDDEIGRIKQMDAFVSLGSVADIINRVDREISRGYQRANKVPKVDDIEEMALDEATKFEDLKD